MFDYLNYVNDSYPIRRTKEQKQKFTEYVINKAKELNFDTNVETLKKEHNNIIIGDVESAKVVFTAHYDTPAASLFPNLMMPRNIILGMCYQFGYPILMSLVSLGIAFGLGILLNTGIEAVAGIFIVIYFSMFYLLTRCFPNKHNKNDNTSGVATILSLMEVNKGKDVAFILFDNEEKGLLGSKAYNEVHKNILENKLVINLDCVGFGDNVICIVKKDAEKLQELKILKDTFESSDQYNVHFFPTNGSMSNSDYKSFKCGVGVMTCKHNKVVGFYTSRIHTRFDTVADSSNIEFITKRLTNFIANL